MLPKYALVDEHDNIIDIGSLLMMAFEYYNRKQHNEENNKIKRISIELLQTIEKDDIDREIDVYWTCKSNMIKQGMKNGGIKK